MDQIDCDNEDTDVREGDKVGDDGEIDDGERRAPWTESGDGADV